MSDGDWPSLPLSLLQNVFCLSRSCVFTIMLFAQQHTGMAGRQPPASGPRAKLGSSPGECTTRQASQCQVGQPSPPPPGLCHPRPSPEHALCFSPGAGSAGAPVVSSTSGVPRRKAKKWKGGNSILLLVRTELPGGGTWTRSSSFTGPTLWKYNTVDSHTASGLPFLSGAAFCPISELLLKQGRSKKPTANSPVPRQAVFEGVEEGAHSGKPLAAQLGGGSGGTTSRRTLVKLRSSSIPAGRPKSCVAPPCPASQEVGGNAQACGVPAPGSL